MAKGRNISHPVSGALIEFKHTVTCGASLSVYHICHYHDVGIVLLIPLGLYIFRIGVLLVYLNKNKNTKYEPVVRL